MENRNSQINTNEDNTVAQVSMKDLEALLAKVSAQSDSNKEREAKTAYADEGQYTVDIKLALLAILKRWWIVLICTLVGGFGMLFYAKMQYVPTYTTKIQIYVNNSTAIRSAEKTSISSADLYASQALINTYTVILKTHEILDQVADDLRVNYNYYYKYNELVSRINTGMVENTEIFYVSVTDQDPNKAIEIANTIAAVLPTRLAETVEGSSARIVDHAKTATLNSPEYTSKVMSGAAVGFALAVLYAVIVGGVLNDKIQDSNWLTGCYPTVPVLAQIPDTKPGGTHSGYGYGYGRYGYGYGHYGYGYGYGHYGYGYAPRANKKKKPDDSKDAGKSADNADGSAKSGQDK